VILGIDRLATLNGADYEAFQFLEIVSRSLPK
jgi:hypothetical protein